MVKLPMEALMAAARALVSATETLAKMDAAADLHRERVRLLREETLPGAMLELGLQRVDLDSGEILKLAQEVYAAIPKARQVEAFTWLAKHKYDAIIKTEVLVAFGKGESKKAMRLYKSLKKDKFAPMMDQSVHASTLKAFLKERMAEGIDVPLDLFGAWPVFTTKLTTKKT